MTVETGTNKICYLGDGSAANVFPFNFKALSAGHILVQRTWIDGTWTASASGGGKKASAISGF